MERERMMLKAMTFVMVSVLFGGLSKAQAAGVHSEWQSLPSDTTVTKIWCCNPEVMPSFRGGKQKLMQFISDNLHYPEEYADSCIQGRVIVSFVIEKDGTVTKPKIVKGLNPAFDQEALRVVRMMPKWNPGSINGERRRMKYTIPVVFKQQ